MASRARRTSGRGSAASITRTSACDRLPRCGRSAEPMSNSDWSIERSLQLYNIPGWGAGYFSINTKGHLVVHPFGQPGPVIDLMDVVDDIRERKLGFPCVVRFQDLLRSRVKQLNDVFRSAIAQHGYKGQYFGVYPTKVNQMREVVEEILDAGAPWHFGLEAGSKGELLIVLALNTDPEALTICNGYKDEEYLRLALMGRKLGRKIMVVIEKLSELPHLLRLSEEMNVQPLIGLRSKLSTKGTGKWESSSGDFAKFGLTTPELIRAIEILRAAGKVEAAKLFHFHVGSQLTDIRTVKDVVNEGARFYAKLRKMGLSSLEYFDVGGGLGVDYVGARSTAHVSSLNYSMEEYAADVVYTVQQICNNDGVAKKEQALTMFKLGILGLEERAAVEGLFWRLCRRLVEINKKRKRVPGPTRGLDDRLADQYMANFSLFQSAPDHWAINQLFPIAPLHRHTEAPTRDSTIVDITCDSDGKIDAFIEGETVDETIALHPLRGGEPYYLGMFLTGAYQDIMGDMHNLFGRVHEVHVFVDDDDPEDYYIEEVIPGDTMERVLARVQYEPSDLAKRIKQALDGKVREGQVKPKESVQLTDFYEQAMRGYTYLGTE